MHSLAPLPGLPLCHDREDKDDEVNQVCKYKEVGNNKKKVNKTQGIGISDFATSYKKLPNQPTVY